MKDCKLLEEEEEESTEQNHFNVPVSISITFDL